MDCPDNHGVVNKDIEEPYSHRNITEEELVEKLSYSDDENNEFPLSDNQKKTVIPYEIGSINNPPVFGSVNVTNSSEVHFGNKTIINGPVTIKQVIGCIDNNGYSPEEESRHNIEIKTSKYYHAPEVNVKWKSRRHILIAIFCVSTIASLIAIVSLLINNKDNEPSVPSPGQDLDVESAPNSTLRYVSRSQWLAQPPSDRLDDLKLPTELVIITHTATQNCSKQSECVFIVRNIQTYHLESREWSDIGYNFLVGGDGAAYVGRGWHYVGAHTLHYNSRSIGIAFIGTFNSVDPPNRQLIACQKLIQEGVQLGKIAKDYKLYGHRQLISTLSPGERLYSIIKTWPHWSNDLKEKS